VKWTRVALVVGAIALFAFLYWSKVVHHR